MSSILEFSYAPSGPDLHIFPTKSLLHLSVCVSDFVAGVPKGLMLYGLVRKSNHRSHFDFQFGAFGMRLVLQALTDWENVKERKQPGWYCHSGNYFCNKFQSKKRWSSYVTAGLQVSILNGTDLKTMINYTGEQVSKRTPIFIHRKFLLAMCVQCQSIFFTGLWSRSRFAIKLGYWGECAVVIWVSVSGNTKALMSFKQGWLTLLDQ